MDEQASGNFEREFRRMKRDDEKPAAEGDPRHEAGNSRGAREIAVPAGMSETTKEREAGNTDRPIDFRAINPRYRGAMASDVVRALVKPKVREMLERREGSEVGG